MSSTTPWWHIDGAQKSLVEWSQSLRERTYDSNARRPLLIEILRNNTALSGRELETTAEAISAHYNEHFNSWNAFILNIDTTFAAPDEITSRFSEDERLEATNLYFQYMTASRASITVSDVMRIRHQILVGQADGLTEDILQHKEAILSYLEQQRAVAQLNKSAQAQGMTTGTSAATSTSARTAENQESRQQASPNQDTNQDHQKDAVTETSAATSTTLGSPEAQEDDQETVSNERALPQEQTSPDPTAPRGTHALQQAGWWSGPPAPIYVPAWAPWAQ